MKRFLILWFFAVTWISASSKIAIAIKVKGDVSVVFWWSKVMFFWCFGVFGTLLGKKIRFSIFLVRGVGF